MSLPHRRTHKCWTIKCSRLGQLLRLLSHPQQWKMQRAMQTSKEYLAQRSLPMGNIVHQRSSCRWEWLVQYKIQQSKRLYRLTTYLQIWRPACRITLRESWLRRFQSTSICICGTVEAGFLLLKIHKLRRLWLRRQVQRFTCW
jgi:hypothetical protein